MSSPERQAPLILAISRVGVLAQTVNYRQTEER